MYQQGQGKANELSIQSNWKLKTDKKLQGISLKLIKKIRSKIYMLRSFSLKNISRKYSCKEKNILNQNLFIL